MQDLLLLESFKNKVDFKRLSNISYIFQFFTKYEIMPKGVYDRLSAKPRTIKGAIKQYVVFCLRDDTAKKLELTVEPWLWGVQLFKEETGIEIRPQKAKNQIGKWTYINGELYKAKQ